MFLEEKDKKKERKAICRSISGLNNIRGEVVRPECYATNCIDIPKLFLVSKESRIKHYGRGEKSVCGMFNHVCLKEDWGAKLCA